MDFIKTSSLRALKRLVQRLYRETAAKPCRTAGRGTHIPRSAKVRTSSVPPEARLSPRTDREAMPRGRAAQLIYRGRSRRPTRKASSHVRPKPSANPSIRRPRRPNAKTLGHDRSDLRYGEGFTSPCPIKAIHFATYHLKETSWTNKRCQALKHHHLLGIVLQKYPLEVQEELLPYLEAADLETSSQAASYREEHLLATPEEEIDPELIEFVKRDQFHDLFSEYALEHIDHFENLCDSYGVFDFEKKMMLFSMSLAGPALDWAQHEPLSQSSHGSILEKLS
ncbi:unnamed protein product [Microthlaspi erraticum]|uniref:Uncharacterized protein n=1 Tax=Microthlaspi erraticum TaxID=1685480 RepID=A0A6D2J0T0_9BRAS|nr:unnamed protein product [Microthlaspi erraticum]